MLQCSSVLNLEVRVMHPSLLVSNYVSAGFVKVCDVCPDNSNKYHWIYKNIDTYIMISDHRSWVYFIVEDDEIVKVGETGNPLGISKKFSEYTSIEDQPLTGTTSRFGRLASFTAYGDTDAWLKDVLSKSVKQKKVSLWAKQCDAVSIVSITVNGTPIKITSHFHKDLEAKIIEHIINETECYPKYNKSKK